MSSGGERVRADEVKRAAATRPDIERVLLREWRVEPRSEEPFVEARLVVVLDPLPPEPIGVDVARELLHLFHPAIVDFTGFGLTIPGAAGIGEAARDAVVLYEQDAS